MTTTTTTINKTIIIHHQHDTTPKQRTMPDTSKLPSPKHHIEDKHAVDSDSNPPPTCGY